MSEYVTFEMESTDNPDVMLLITNQDLTQDETSEHYPTPEDGEAGSPIAQTLFFGVSGIQALTIDGNTLIITRQDDVIWELLLDDIRNTLRDFFL